MQSLKWNQNIKENKHKCQIETPNGFKDGLWSLHFPDTVQKPHDSHICETLFKLLREKQLSSLLSEAGNNRLSNVTDWQTDRQAEVHLLSGLATHSWYTQHSFNKEAVIIAAAWRLAAKHFMVRLKTTFSSV